MMPATEIINKYETQIGARGVTLYLRMRELAGKGNQLQRSIKRLSEALEANDQTVRRYLRRMAAANMITIQQTIAEDGDQDSNIYTLLV